MEDNIEKGADQVQDASNWDEVAWRKSFESQKHMLTEISLCLDAVFTLEKELKNKCHFVNVDYSISKQEGSYIFFAKFKINKGSTSIERTFLFDIWHSVAGYEENRRHIEAEIKNFRHALSNFTN